MKQTHLSSLGFLCLSHSYRASLAKAPFLYHLCILEMVMEFVTISIIPSSRPVAIQPQGFILYPRVSTKSHHQNTKTGCRYTNEMRLIRRFKPLLYTCTCISSGTLSLPFFFKYKNCCHTLIHLRPLNSHSILFTSIKFSNTHQVVDGQKREVHEDIYDLGRSLQHRVPREQFCSQLTLQCNAVRWGLGPSLIPTAC